MTRWAGRSVIDAMETVDHPAALDGAVTFAGEALAPLVDHPEVVLPMPELEGLLVKAADCGLLPTAAGGEGLWGAAGAPPGFALEALRLIAGVNGGVAFAVHRMALAARLRARLGLAASTPAAVSLHGHYGLGRDALPRLLADRELRDLDVVLLNDWLDLASHERVVVSAPWESLIAAGFYGREIVWREVLRADCTVRVQPNSHGFDELEMATVQGPLAEGTAGTDLYAEALYLDGLGMTAIAAGVVDHGLQIAREYARQRRQGGAAIETYPAVQQMLAQISATARAGTQHLAFFASREPTAEALAELCAVRSAFHPACCIAANNAIQVLGGRGYMQDFGPEKLARDANTLRVLGGTPTELSLFVAEWERAE
jgi:acyl-CoA dehydrogenase